ncbi:MAG: apolipoprotein N-acyltransferase [Phycisphaera sp.]|nr:MAG: apolipoprotein N-acyltransferase [Phycisphaera sp.]
MKYNPAAEESPVTDRPEASESGKAGALKWWHALVAGLLYSVLMFGAFPPMSLWALSFLAPFPLMYVAWKTPRPFRHGLCVLIGSIPFYAYQFTYVIDISVAGYVPLVVYLAAWPALFVWLGGAIRRRLPWLAASVLLPVAWVGVDVFRGEVLFGGFEWYQVGQPLIANVFLASTAGIGGPYFVTLLAVVPAAVAIELRGATNRKRLVAAGIFWCSLVGWGLGLASSLLSQGEGGETREARIALVQTNVSQDNKLGWSFEQRQRDFDEFVALTGRAVLEKPELIVWPETMFPGIALDSDTASMLERERLGHLNGFREQLLSVQNAIGVPMLVGAQRADNVRVIEEGGRVRFEHDGAYNSAFVVSEGSVLDERYDKLSPTPFGETLPYIKSWPWLQDLVLQIGLGASGMDFGLESGEDPKPLLIETRGGKIRVATPICFESTQSAVCRRIVNAGDGADLMILMTNDGWFADLDAGRQMHLLLARWRCVELGLPMARCANTGITSFIDRAGTVTHQLEPREAGVLVETARLDAHPTVYRRIGNLVGWLSLAGLGVFWLLAVAQRFNPGAVRGPKKDL